MQQKDIHNLLTHEQSTLTIMLTLPSGAMSFSTTLFLMISISSDIYKPGFSTHGSPAVVKTESWVEMAKTGVVIFAKKETKGGPGGLREEGWGQSDMKWAEKSAVFMIWKLTDRNTLSNISPDTVPIPYSLKMSYLIYSKKRYPLLLNSFIFLMLK